MSWQDGVNGAFELFGGFVLLLHVRRLYIDKVLSGVSVVATAYFVTWGFWNLYYYPHLEQWISLVGAIAVVFVNVVWISMMAYYIRWPGGRYKLTEKPISVRETRSSLTFD